MFVCFGVVVLFRLNGDSLIGIVEVNMEFFDYICGLDGKVRSIFLGWMGFCVEDVVIVVFVILVFWVCIRFKIRSWFFGFNVMVFELVFRLV